MKKILPLLSFLVLCSCSDSNNSVGDGGIDLSQFDGPQASPLQGQPCPPAGCGAGLECVTYQGGATCEIKCVNFDPQVCPNQLCPQEQICTNISDGPGRVCRPDDRGSNTIFCNNQNRPCPDGYFCELSAGCNGCHEGTCIVPETDCSQSQPPVNCGCDGKNYDNACLRIRARVALDRASACAN